MRDKALTVNLNQASKNKKSFENEVMAQLRKDFEMVGIPLPDELLTDKLTTAWQNKFEKHLQFLLNDKNDKLIQLLYRMDVNEKPLMSLNKDEYRHLATLIISREKEKVTYRREH